MSAEMCKCGRNRIFSGDNACEECIIRENEGDLISRKEVKDMLSKKFEGVKETGNCACVAYIEGGRTDIFYAIDSIPTAYDVDKVIEKIKNDDSVKCFGSVNSGNLLIQVSKAVDIVKRGGVE